MYLGPSRNGTPGCPGLRRGTHRPRATTSGSAEELPRKRPRALRYALGEAAIPARFIGRTLTTLARLTRRKKSEPADGQTFADSFEETNRLRQGVDLSGKPGTGEPPCNGHPQAIMPQHIGLYITCMSLIRQVRATWRRDSEQSEGEVLQMLGDVSLLVLDGSGSSTVRMANKPSSTFWTAAP